MSKEKKFLIPFGILMLWALVEAGLARKFSVDGGMWPLVLGAAVIFSAIYCIIFSLISGCRELRDGYLIGFGFLFAAPMAARSLAYYLLHRVFAFNSSGHGDFVRFSMAVIDSSWTLPVVAIISLVFHFFISRHIAFFTNC